jgi:hypothetical protein
MPDEEPADGFGEYAHRVPEGHDQGGCPCDRCKQWRYEDTVLYGKREAPPVTEVPVSQLNCCEPTESGGHSDECKYQQVDAAFPAEEVPTPEDHPDHGESAQYVSDAVIGFRNHTAEEIELVNRSKDMERMIGVFFKELRTRAEDTMRKKDDESFNRGFQSSALLEDAKVQMRTAFMTLNRAVFLPEDPYQ